jgi:predicted GIY-YIG superfamily endonuclease
VTRGVRTRRPIAGVVYIAHSAEGELLYVGVTRDLRNRLAQHKSRSAWWAPDVVITEESFDNIFDAMGREAELIKQLRPPFNPPPRRVLAVSGELRRQLEQAAEREGMAVRELFEEALRDKLARLERQDRRAAE